MKNQELIDLLTKIVQYLYLIDENIFKIRAYEKAIKTIENLPKPIEEFKNNPEKLYTLDGIGKGIGEKILEYLFTGKIVYYEDLKKQFPESLIEIMSVPGMGPKRTKLLYQKFGIENVKMLKEYAQRGVLENLEGFGKKVVQNILDGINFKSESGLRLLYNEAESLSKDITSFLTEDETISKIDVCGSFRRKKETVGDIDILCCPKKENDFSVIEKFTKYPGVKKVLSQGETKASIVINKNVQVDLRLIKKSSYGSALQYFTGSKEHNIQLREYALEKGYSISEYGVFEVDTKKYVCGKTEDEVYNILGLQYVEPELREGQGEILFAKQNKLPKLLSLKDIKGDTHIHSTFSDGMNTIEEIVHSSEELGYEWIIICDHSKSLKVAHGLDEKELQKKISEIKKVSNRTKLKIFCGTEVDILSDGSLDYSDEILAQIDFVIAAIHTGFKQSEEQITDRILRAMENRYVHAISHPTGRILLKRDSYKVNISKIIEAAKRYNVLMEINAYPDRLDLNDINTKYGKENGVKFCIGTDAHSIKHLNYISYGINVARRGWLERKDVVNTMSAKEIEKYLNFKK